MRTTDFTKMSAMYMSGKHASLSIIMAVHVQRMFKECGTFECLDNYYFTAHETVLGGAAPVVPSHDWTYI